MVSDTEIIVNSVLLLFCYLYIAIMILISTKLGSRFQKELRRKFLHIMIGNFVYIIPYFTLNSFPLNFPFLVASPFILLTFFASPKSPVLIKQKIGSLSDLTTSGHGFGLLLYAISYTVLAFFFSSKPYVIMAGILPLAFGDAAASIVGRKFGCHKLNFSINKSIEGSLAMFLTTFISTLFSMMAFSYFYSFPFTVLLFSILSISIVATFLEAYTPKGLDNLSVPLVSATLFLFLTGGV